MKYIVGDAFGFWLQTPSLTPKDSNNPSWRIVDYNTTSYHVEDYTQFITGLTEIQRTGKIGWYEEYVFSKLYKINSGVINTQAIQDAISLIASDPIAYQTWNTNYNTQYEDPDSKLKDYCNMVYSQTDDQELCQERGIYQTSTNDII